MPQSVFPRAKDSETKDGVKKVPRHVAIIMDGNRRWASKMGVPTKAGHWKGAQTLTNIVEAAINIGIEVLTVYAFSTENWARPESEIESLFELFKIYLHRMRNRMIQKGVKLSSIGDFEPLPDDVKVAFEATRKATEHCKNIELVLAFNYGGRDDLRRAVLKVIDDIEAGKIRKEELTEERFSQYLDTASIGDPDLLIRTSGEKRISNFLLWQISYSEVYMTDVLWPEFTEEHLLESVEEYNRRVRRLGT